MKKRSPNPKHHKLKLNDAYWNAVMDGKKTAEIRTMDRDFQVGDFITFRRVPATFWPKSSGKFKITHILTHEEFPYGLAHGCGLLSIQPYEKTR